MTRAHDYTPKECRDRIRELDERIRKLETTPQRFMRGNISSQQQSLSDLREEREKWEKRLEEAKARYDGSSPLQGPDKKLT